MTFFPNLRFPGFEGEWEVNRFQEVVKINQGLQIPISDRLVSPRDGAYFYITNEFLKDNSEKKYFIKNPPLSVLCNKEDILMTRTGNTGKVVTGVVGAFHNNFFKVSYPKNIVKGFLYNFLKLPSIQNQISKLAGTSTIPDLNHSDFYRIKFSYPTFEEQQKIAEFVSFLDSRIQTQRKIISELLSQMSNLKDLILEQRLRFKDSNGNNFSDWKYFKLSDLGKTFNGLSGKTKEHFGAGQKYIQYKQIFDSAKINIENCAFVDVEENENQNTVQYGDVFFTISSETPEEIGMSSVLLENVDNVYLNSFCFGFRATSFDKLIPEFSQFLFRSNTFRNEIIKLAQGSTRYNMSKTEFLKLNVKLPCKDEQTKIANFLSSIQEKIETEKRILENLELQKKFLLANLFV